APRAGWRSAVVASAGSEWSEAAAAACPVSDDDRHASAGRGHRGYLWAELMRRTFGIDVLDCPRCGGRLRLLALIEHARIVERILRHLGLPTDRPEPRPARAPPVFGKLVGLGTVVMRTILRGSPDDALERVSHYATEPAAKRLERIHPDVAARLWCA